VLGQAPPGDLGDNLDLLLTRPAMAPAVLVGALVASRLVRLAITAGLRRLSRRSLERPTSWWRTRLPRAFGESREQAESRRQQRIDATGRMVGHLISVVISIAALLWALHVLGVDPILVLTSAGFLGAGLAFGGQHLVRDYLAGLTVLVEDRYGSGDRITITVDGNEVHGTVDHLGAFSTRLIDGDTTWHLSNGSLLNIRNHDQSPATTELLIQAPPTGDRATLAAAVSDAVERVASPLASGVVLVDDVAADIERTGQHPVVRVSVRTPRPLSDAEQDRLRRAVEQHLDPVDHHRRHRTRA
jgi:moderate conductance mechanosensitive channel